MKRKSLIQISLPLIVRTCQKKKKKKVVKVLILVTVTLGLRFEILLIANNYLKSCLSAKSESYMVYVEEAFCTSTKFFQQKCVQ